MDVRRALSLVVPLLMLFVGAPAVAQSNDAKVLVRKIAHLPARYYQVCSFTPRDPSLAVAVNFSGRSSYSEHAISAEQFGELRSRRDEVITVLHEWLKDVAGGGAEETEPELSDKELKEMLRPGQGHTPFVDVGRYKLLMLVDLNDVSALPLLKAYAVKWHKIYREASPLTEVDWRNLGKSKDDIYMKARAQDRLGDILSTIIAILRQERFERVLSSQLEKGAEAKMAESAKVSSIEELRRRVNENGREIAEKDRAWIFMDPVLDLPMTSWAYPKLTISDKTVVQILAWVDEYQKLPAKKRLDAKGMMPWPIER